MKRLRDDEAGQSLLYGAGVVVIVVALFYGALDVGLLVLGKIQAQTAADAAALAASGLKASVHNTRSLAYRAASGQIAMTRMQLVYATGLALEGLIDGSAEKKTKFREAISRAHHHRENVFLLHTGIKNYNAWLTTNDLGDAQVKRAAEAAYAGNIGVLGVMDRYNLALIKRNDALLELSNESKMLGGTVFPEEVIAKGSGGKSHVAVEPRVNALGSGLLGYGAQAGLKVASTAGPIDAKLAYGKSLQALDPLKGYGVNWYTVRLLPIGGDGQ